MNRAAFRAEVSERVFDDSNAIATTSTVNLWLDLAVRSLWKVYPWPWRRATATFSTVIGTDIYALPADVQEIRKLVYPANQLVLVHRTERWLEEMYPDPTIKTGPPMFYVDGGLLSPSNLTAPPQRQIKLYPTPDSVYALRLRYHALPKLFSTQGTPDSAFSPFPEDFDEAIIQWCLVRYCRKLGDAQGEALARQTLTEEVTNLLGVYSQITEAYPIIDDEDYQVGNFYSANSTLY